MNNAEPEHRTAQRQSRDAKIAAEPNLSPPQLTPNARPAPLEQHLASHLPHPIAVPGVVENGLVRPLDPAVKLTERARVIIVASEAD